MLVSGERLVDDEHVHGNTLGVDGSQVGVFEEGDEVGFSGLLESEDGRRLEAQVGLGMMLVSTIVNGDDDNEHTL
jgi:hypothetical protein